MKTLCSCGMGNYIKSGHTMCRECYIGKERFSAEKKRNRLRNLLRDIKRPKRFTCEMGYGECESRGYCNGDC